MAKKSYSVKFKLVTQAVTTIFVMDLCFGFFVSRIKTGKELVEFQEQGYEKMDRVRQIAEQTSTMRFWLGDVVATWDVSSIKNAKAAKEKLEVLVKEMESDAPEISAKLLNLSSKLNSEAIEALTSFSSDQKVQGKAHMAAIRSASIEMDTVLKSAFDKYRASGIQEVTKLSTDNGILTSWAIIIMAFTTFLGLIFGWRLERSISNPLADAAESLKIENIRISDSSRNLSDASESASAAVNEQASAIQETSTSMSEMQTMVKLTLRHASESEDIAIAVADKTEKGKVIMQEMVASMDAVSQQNAQLQNITKIIGEISEKANVINKIVDKTQLLSFNASLEAARAGEHGKGFAIVANEVGNLAALSGEAATEIQDLLNRSQIEVSQIIDSTADRVENGVAVCKEANTIFDEIALDITTVSGQVKAVRNASSEQAVGLDQIAEAMGQMGSSTQVTNDIANQNAELAKGLLEEAEILKRISNSIDSLVFGGTDVSRANKNRNSSGQRSGNSNAKSSAAAAKDQMSGDNNIFDAILEKIGDAKDSGSSQSSEVVDQSGPSGDDSRFNDNSAA